MPTSACVWPNSAIAVVRADFLERLAEQYRYPEAVITLASDLYTDPNESTDSFAGFLGADSDYALDARIARPLKPFFVGEDGTHYLKVRSWKSSRRRKLILHWR